jgi:hypothetical protein
MKFDSLLFNSGYCQICGIKFDSKNGLCRHITRGHKTTLKQYFVDFGGKIEYCECGAEQTWLFAEMKFSGFCPSRACSMAQIRRSKKNDLLYRLNISNAMKEVWERRPRTEECKQRKIAEEVAKKRLRVIESDDWPLPDHVFENLSNFFNTNGSIRKI